MLTILVTEIYANVRFSKVITSSGCDVELPSPFKDRKTLDNLQVSLFTGIVTHMFMLLFS